LQTILPDAKQMVATHYGFAVLTSKGSVVMFLGGDQPQPNPSVEGWFEKRQSLCADVASLHTNERSFAALKHSGQVITWGGHDTGVRTKRAIP